MSSLRETGVRFSATVLNHFDEKQTNTRFVTITSSRLSPVNARGYSHGTDILKAAVYAT